MDAIPTYQQWREALVAWATSKPTRLQTTMTGLAAEVYKETGKEVSAFTLRYHVEGRYRDAGIDLASAVWRVIQAQD
jgi:hypothetical protein